MLTRTFHSLLSFHCWWWFIQYLVKDSLNIELMVFQNWFDSWFNFLDLSTMTYRIKAFVCNPKFGRHWFNVLVWCVIYVHIWVQRFVMYVNKDFLVYHTIWITKKLYCRRSYLCKMCGAIGVERFRTKNIISVILYLLNSCHING